MILSFRTDTPGQTVQSQISSSRGAVWSGSTLFAILSASFGLNYSMVEPHRSNFRVITMNFLGVRTFRKFTVLNLSNWTLKFYLHLQSSKVFFFLFLSEQEKMEQFSTYPILFMLPCTLRTFNGNGCRYRYMWHSLEFWVLLSLRFDIISR